MRTRTSYESTGALPVVATVPVLSRPRRGDRRPRCPSRSSRCAARTRVAVPALRRRNQRARRLRQAARCRAPRIALTSLSACTVFVLPALRRQPGSAPGSTDGGVPSAPSRIVKSDFRKGHGRRLRALVERGEVSGRWVGLLARVEHAVGQRSRRGRRRWSWSPARRAPERPLGLAHDEATRQAVPDVAPGGSTPLGCGRHRVGAGRGGSHASASTSASTRVGGIETLREERGRLTIARRRPSNT